MSNAGHGGPALGGTRSEKEKRRRSTSDAHSATHPSPLPEAIEIAKFWKNRKGDGGAAS